MMNMPNANMDTNMNFRTSREKLLQEQKERQNYIKIFWDIFKRRWWLVLVILLLAEVFTFFFAKIPEGPFKASAVVRPVTPRGSSIMSPFGNVPSMYRGTAETEFEIIKGRKVAERVIDKLGITHLYARPDPKRKDESPDMDQLMANLPPEVRRRALMSELQNRLEVNWKMNERKAMVNLISITARSYSPQEAMDIANAVAESYIEIHDEYKQKAWQELINLLAIELEKARAAYEESRRQLYRNATEKDIAAAFGSVLGGSQFAASDLPVGISALRARIMDMEIQLQVMEKDLPPAHPRVLSIKKELGEIRQRLEKEEANAKEKYSQQFGLTSTAAEVTFNQQLFNMLASSQQSLKAQYIMEKQSPEIVEYALQPLAPSQQSRRTGLSMAAAVAIILGLGLSLLLEYLDSSMRNEVDVARFINLPVIGSIPRLKDMKKKPESDALITYNGMNNGLKPSRESWVRDLYKESYRAFQLEALAAVNEVLAAGYKNESISSGNKHSGVALMITSSVPDEGKSIVVANLAISIAQTGRNVLLVDSDCRHSVQHGLMGLENTIGLTDILLGKVSWDAAIKKSSIGNLHVIVSGQRDGQTDTSALLSSPALGEFVDSLRKEFDVVILDSPAASLASESAAMGSVVDGVVLVIKSGVSKKDDIIRAKEIVQYSGGNILGALLNFSAVGKKDRGYYSPHSY